MKKKLKIIQITYCQIKKAEKSNKPVLLWPLMYGPKHFTPKMSYFPTFFNSYGIDSHQSTQTPKYPTKWNLLLHSQW